MDIVIELDNPVFVFLRNDDAIDYALRNFIEYKLNSFI